MCSLSLICARQTHHIQVSQCLRLDFLRGSQDGTVSTAAYYSTSAYSTFSRHQDPVLLMAILPFLMRGHACRRRRRKRFEIPLQRIPMFALARPCTALAFHTYMLSRTCLLHLSISPSHSCIPHQNPTHSGRRRCSHPEQGVTLALGNTSESLRKLWRPY